MNTFFTADTHFGHRRILEYCKRPFATVYEMDKALVANWNRVVKPGDTIYHLGDVAFCCTSKYYSDIFFQLNGTKHLILGNHDKLAEKHIAMYPTAWASVQQMKEIDIADQKIVMCHYPMRTWHHSYRGTWQLYGHVHGTFPDYGKSTDVGVDCWDYTPVSFDQLKDHMDKRAVASADVIAKKNEWDKTPVPLTT